MNPEVELQMTMSVGLGFRNFLLLLKGMERKTQQYLFEQLPIFLNMLVKVWSGHFNPSNVLVGVVPCEC